MKIRLFFAAGLMLAPLPAAAQAPAVDDPYVWLEDKDGPRAMAWVEAENAKTLPRLEQDPRYAGFFDAAVKIAAAQDRIPMPAQTNGRILNFWRDTDHPHGIWRWTTPASYATAAPQWTVLLDLDVLGKAEGKTWVWKGANCLPPEERYCLLNLSEGGEDATTVREFDLVAGKFVEGGFSLPVSKQDVAWEDKDTILLARDWGPGTLTASGYPFVVKRLGRGKPLDNAVEVYRGTPEDIGASPGLLTDAQGNRAMLLVRYKSFFDSEKLLLTPAGAVKLPLPGQSSIQAMLDGRVLIRTSEDWKPGDGATIPAGALVSVALADLKDGGAISPTVVFQPGPRQSIDGIATTRGKLILTYSDNVRGRAAVYTPTAAGWTSAPLALPDNASIGVVSSTDRSDAAFLSVTSFITPTTLWSVDATTAVPTQVRAAPPRFDASALVVEQFQAPSSDGTMIPYFVVHRKDVALDGGTPTIMTAYGGFEVSETPYYLSTLGKLWLERGGSFVLANIRGGGEFGPKWHQAGLKTKRQIIYDDFAGVARDLTARKLTSAAKLGIYGGSNGGLLMGVEFNQHPELWKAVVIQVPLLDMLRYEQIQAGASWVGEYGSVSVPEERAFLAKISPYRNLRKGGAYPEPFIWTTTKDDRVGPQHARKFAARMAEYGLPYLYYEDTAGGHSGDADIKQGARLQALQAVYFSQKLMDAGK